MEFSVKLLRSGGCLSLQHNIAYPGLYTTQVQQKGQQGPGITCLVLITSFLENVKTFLKLFQNPFDKFQ